MTGYLLTFYIEQNQTHQHQSLGNWLMALARDTGLKGATLFPASQGFGANHRLHAAHFFELADQPMAVVMALSAEEKEMILQKIQQESLHIFYTLVPADYGFS